MFTYLKYNVNNLSCNRSEDSGFYSNFPPVLKKRASHELYRFDIYYHFGIQRIQGI
jgi:hypothetical protein